MPIESWFDTERARDSEGNVSSRRQNLWTRFGNIQRVERFGRDPRGLGNIRIGVPDHTGGVRIGLFQNGRRPGEKVEKAKKERCRSSKMSVGSKTYKDIREFG